MPGTYSQILLHVVFSTKGRVASIKPETQAEHHVKRGSKEELLALLKAHGVDFDEQYVFD
jgi:hypothetical protein